MEPAKSNQSDGQQQRKNAVRSHADRTQNVAAVELRDRQEIQGGDKERDPSGAAYWGQQQRVGRNPRAKSRFQKPQQKGRTVDQFRLRGIGKLRNELRMQDSVGQRGNREDETHDRP